MDINIPLDLSVMSAEEQTHERCLAAVKNNGLDLRYVKEKTSELCLEAVKQNAEAMKYVPKEMQSLPMALIALRQDHECCKYLAPQFRTAAVFKAAGYHDYQPEALAEPQHDATRTQNPNRG